MAKFRANCLSKRFTEQPNYLANYLSLSKRSDSEQTIPLSKYVLDHATMRVATSVVKALAVTAVAAGVASAAMGEAAAAAAMAVRCGGAPRLHLEAAGAEERRVHELAPVGEADDEDVVERVDVVHDREELVDHRVSDARRVTAERSRLRDPGGTAVRSAAPSPIDAVRAA